MNKYFIILLTIIGCIGQVNSARAQYDDNDMVLYVTSVEWDTTAGPSDAPFSGTWQGYATLEAEKPMSAGTFTELCLGTVSGIGVKKFYSDSSKCASLGTATTYGEAARLWINRYGGSPTGGTFPSRVGFSDISLPGDCVVFAFVYKGVTSGQSKFEQMTNLCVPTPPVEQIPCLVSVDDIDFGEIADTSTSPDQEVDITLECELDVTQNTTTIRLASFNMFNGTNYLDGDGDIQYEFSFDGKTLDDFVEIPIDTSSGGRSFSSNALSIKLTFKKTDIAPGTYSTIDTILYDVF
ncbi:TPA: hypothetical protein ACGTRQ_003809 [Vibrio parahaemolyticus]